MDGLLVVDKPVGPTSHDVVARVRRALGERRVGHTGTLDPLASGVLPLVIGRATRLARFLSGADKSYDAIVRLGFATDTGDREGTPLGPPHSGPFPSRADIERALDHFRGEFRQRPPTFSAKKIGGVRSYALAHAARRRPDRAAAEPPPLPEPITVRASIELRDVRDDAVALRIRCSAGFYVRSLAHDLGEALGTGGHLDVLRRTASGELTLADAVALDQIEREPASMTAAIVPLGRMLPGIAALTLTPQGVARACQGRDLGPGDFVSSDPAEASRPGWENGRPRRLLDAGGDLVAMAEPSATAGLLHPSIVLR